MASEHKYKQDDWIVIKKNTAYFAKEMLDHLPEDHRIQLGPTMHRTGYVWTPDGALSYEIFDDDIEKLSDNQTPASRLIQRLKAMPDITTKTASNTPAKDLPGEYPPSEQDKRDAEWLQIPGWAKNMHRQLQRDIDELIVEMRELKETATEKPVGNGLYWTTREFHHETVCDIVEVINGVVYKHQLTERYSHAEIKALKWGQRIPYPKEKP